MRSKTRYQGAIVRDGAVLLIQHREHATGRGYWLLPGGGMEAGETPEQTVAREMVEETGLHVAVERLVLDRPSVGNFYEREHTYLCTALGPDARPAPGHEPEVDASAVYAIVDVRWVPLHDENHWGAEILSDPITAGYLRALQSALAKATGDLPATVPTA